MIMMFRLVKRAVVEIKTSKWHGSQNPLSKETILSLKEPSQKQKVEKSKIKKKSIQENNPVELLINLSKLYN